MSMASMLGKMVVAGLVAKGVGKVMGGGGSSAGGGRSSAGGGLGGILGGLLAGGKSGGGGGLGGLLGSLAGGSNAAQQQTGGIGDILDAFANNKADNVQPTANQNQQAEVLMRAMLNAIKSDGKIDDAEQQRIVKHLGDVSDNEMQFVRNEMNSPLDVDTFVRSVPKGMEQQVYLMSLTSIDLDSKPEAEYLHKLAQGLGISQQACNQIHQQAGAPALYS
ncbi:MAG: DUF533 domain-containing protein [Gammaproteobacteria bacterium]